MQEIDIFELLGLAGKLPPIDKRIPKNQLFIHGNLNGSERDLISGHIEEMRLKYVLNSHTFPMEMIKNSEEQYDLILFADIRIKEMRASDRIARLLQVAIPSPLVLIFRYENQVQFSTALKRLNQKGRSTVVVAEHHTGNWMNLSSLTLYQQQFVESIRLELLPVLDYKQAYTHIHQQIYTERYAQVVANVAVNNDFGTVKKQTEQKLERLAEIDRLKKQLNRKGTSLREKVKLAGEIKRLQKEV